MHRGEKNLRTTIVSRWFSLVSCGNWVSFLEHSFQSLEFKYMGSFHFRNRFFCIHCSKSSHKFIKASFTQSVSGESAYSLINKLTPKYFPFLSHIYFLIRLEVFHNIHLSFYFSPQSSYCIQQGLNMRCPCTSDLQPLSE